MIVIVLSEKFMKKKFNLHHNFIQYEYPCFISLSLSHLGELGQTLKSPAVKLTPDLRHATQEETTVKATTKKHFPLTFE